MDTAQLQINSEVGFYMTICLKYITWIEHNIYNICVYFKKSFSVLWINLFLNNNFRRLLKFLFCNFSAVREDRMPGGRNSGAVYNMYKVLIYSFKAY